MTQRLRFVVTSVAAGGVLALALGAPAVAGQWQGRGQGAKLPDTLQLPDGFRPEGIAIGPGPAAYFGSLADGDIYRVNLRTGKGAVISQGPGTPSVGVKLDGKGRLFVAGGTAGNARVVDTRTGRILASYQLAEGTTFINDVLLFKGAAWFTDSNNKVLYKLRLGRNGALPAKAERLDIQGVDFPAGLNSNGIAPTPDRKALLVVQTNQSRLLRIDPASGQATVVDLGGQTLEFGDGLLLRGRTLYVVQNRANLVAELKLNASGTAGKVLRRISDPRFDVPTTVAALGHRLYLPNARFTTTPTPTTPYNAVAISVR